jgi:hypothetical protein
MSAIYNSLQFKTPLEARWAAFFDLAGWSWHTNPAPVDSWQPDFRVTFECDHSECAGSHTLLVAVLPVEDISGFKSHPCMSHAYGVQPTTGRDAGKFIASGGAAFGLGPAVTEWTISHGAGGGVEDIYFRVPNADALWLKAGQLVE